MRQKVSFLLGLFLGLFFLFLVFRKINIKEVLGYINKIDIAYLLFFVFFSLIATIVRSIRWKIVLSSYKHIKTMNIFKGIIVSIGSNYFLPLRMGDFVQAYFLATKEDLSKSFTLGTVILEHYLDIVIMICFLILSSLYFVLPVSPIILFFALFILIFILFLFAKKIKKIVENINIKNKLINKLFYFVKKILEGLTILQNLYIIILAFFISLLLWLIYALKIYLLLKAFNIEISCLNSIFVLSISSLGVLLPSAPGYVGGLEFFTVSALMILKIKKEIAVGYSLISRVVETGIYLPLTFIFLFSEKKLIKGIKESMYAFRKD